MPDVTRLGPRVQPSRAGRALRRLLRPRSGFRWNLVHEYDDVVNRALTHPETPYVRFRCVMPSWDNSARGERWAWIYRGSTRVEIGDPRLLRFGCWSVNPDALG